ncbi:MAG TPA: hypothetical protein VFK11_01850 [Candidatus Saccharimonadales bacterium]|nr:hypothetical protein [Candidatus Saccharimonadales bacterium]
MTINSEILRLQESVPCADCPLVSVCEDARKEFPDPMEMAKLDRATDWDYDEDAVTPEGLSSFPDPSSAWKSPSITETYSVPLWNYLKKRLVTRDVYNAYALLTDSGAQVYTFGCRKPYKRFKFFGRLGCNGLVLDEPSAVRRYELRTQKLEELRQSRQKG